MNKIFTLIASALLTSATALAQDTRAIDLSAFAENGGHAGSSVTAQADGSYAFQCPDAWGWFSSYYGVTGEDGTTVVSGLDLSDYSYIVLELAEPASFGVSVQVQYIDGTANNSGSLAAGGTVLNVPLVEAAKGGVVQFALQNGAAGTFLVKSLYAAKEQQIAAELNINLSGFSGLTANADGSYTVPGSWAWNALWLGDTDWSDYAYIVAELAEPAPNTAKVQVQYVAGDDTEQYGGAGDSRIVAELPAAQRGNVKQLALQGAEDWKISRLYLTNDPTATAIDRVAPAARATADETTYNLAGQRVGKDYKGVVVRGGKKMVQR